jgi:aminopeptidase N
MRISIPVWVKTEKGDVLVPMEMTGRSATVSRMLDAPPVAVWVDPYLEALKTIEVSQPEAWTLGALRSGPTHAAKRQALAALAKVESPDARMAILETVRNDSLRYSLRIDAVNALAGFGSKESQEAVLALARSPIADVRVRAAVIGALEKVPAAEAVPLCCNLLVPPNGGAGEASYIVRVQAIDVLTAHAAKDAIDTVRAQVAVPSHNESISAAALRYLGKFGTASDVERIEARTALGLPDRVRPAAVSALADVAQRLTGDERTKVETFLIGLLDDAEDRTALAAGGALAELKCQAAKERLRAIAEHHRDPSWRKRAAGWLKKFEA